MQQIETVVMNFQLRLSRGLAINIRISRTIHSPITAANPPREPERTTDTSESTTTKSRNGLAAYFPGRLMAGTAANGINSSIRPE
jgi:hypothetical protein